MKTLAVAINTLRESVRDRVLYLLLFFSLLMMGCSRILSELSVGDAEKIIVDVGLGSISLFSVLIAIFMGIGLVSREIEKRTIYGIVTKPISRTSFVLGKFAGMLLTMTLNMVVMASAFALMLWGWGVAFRASHAFALVLSLVEAALLLALAMLYSALASPLLAAMFTLTSYVVGHVLDGLRLLIERLPQGAGRAALAVFYRVFPNLELLNLKNQVVFGDAASDAALRSQFVQGLAYGGGYIMAVLALAALAYRRKDFV